MKKPYEAPNHKTFILSGASRCFFFPIRSGESVGSRSEALPGFTRFSHDGLLDLR